MTAVILRGSFADLRSDYTLTMTDVKTGWTVHFALRNKAAVWVKQALEMARITLPMGLKGIHSDTGSEFINEPVDKWCQVHGVEFTRGRPTHKNDNCYVEQKNYATVRKIIGYARYEGDQGVSALQAVYSYDPLLNLYYPCMKQISCERIGAKKNGITMPPKRRSNGSWNSPSRMSLKEYGSNQTYGLRMP